MLKSIGKNPPKPEEEEEISNLEKSIIKKNQQIKDETAGLKQLEIEGKKYELFNPANEDHERHFENMFIVFMESG